MEELNRKKIAENIIIQFRYLNLIRWNDNLSLEDIDKAVEFNRYARYSELKA